MKGFGPTQSIEVFLRPTAWLARRSRGKLAASVSPRQRRRTVNLCQLDF